MSIHTFDIWYLVLVLPTFLFSLICSFTVRSTFKKYDRMQTLRNITGQAAAEQVCRMEEARNVRIMRVAGNLTDHYDPRTQVIALSEPVFSSSSVAAAAVAAHEAGHAGQYANGYGPVKLRSALLPVCSFGSRAYIFLIVLGIALSMDILINLGILAFALIFIFQLVTLPVEFNASRRAMAALRSGHLLDGEELVGARRVLTAAAMTYVAAMSVSLAQLLRLLLRSRRR